MTDVWTDMVRGAGQGAALGSVVPGVGTAIGAAAGGLLGVAMNLAPGAAHWLGGSADVATKAAQAVQAVTGQTDAVAAQAAVDADAGLAGNLRVQLAQIATDARAEENRAAEARDAAFRADVQNARDQMTKLAQMQSPLSHGAAVVSAVLLLAWFASMVASYFGATALGADDGATLRNLAIGVAGYWIGSSAGSAAKDRRLAAAAR